MFIYAKETKYELEKSCVKEEVNEFDVNLTYRHPLRISSVRISLLTFKNSLCLIS